jgi:hypothetical protein
MNVNDLPDSTDLAQKHCLGRELIHVFAFVAARRSTFACYPGKPALGPATTTDNRGGHRLGEGGIRQEMVGGIFRLRPFHASFLEYEGIVSKQTCCRASVASMQGSVKRIHGCRGALSASGQRN